LPPSRSATQSGIAGSFEVFQYPAESGSPSSPMWQRWEDPAADPSAQSEIAVDRGRAAADAEVRAELERRLAEEAHRSFEAGRGQGRQEGQLAERQAQAQAMSQAADLHKQQAVELIESFARERDRFLRQVEHEVVELALAVAARILRREAQMDPLLLTGAVRVALGQLSGSTAVKLRVPPAELDLWNEALALVPNTALKPAVVAGDGMRLGDCLIETELGSVDLGIRSQLGEIERGFFDRAALSRIGSNAGSRSAPEPVASNAPREQHS